MSHVHFAAWGAIDIESMERMQRRVYIRKVREMLSEYDIVLMSGGSRNNPHYIVQHKDETFGANGDGAFAKVLTRALQIVDQLKAARQVEEMKRHDAGRSGVQAST